MRHFNTILVIFSFAALSANANKGADWITGKILDSNAVRTYVDSSATANITATSSTTSVGQARIRTMAIQETQLLVAGKEYAYLINDPVAKPVGLRTHGIVTRKIMNHGHGCRFIVGDDIKYYQDKSTLHVIDADGKECKLDILRQERLK